MKIPSIPISHLKFNLVAILRSPRILISLLFVFFAIILARFYPSPFCPYPFCPPPFIHHDFLQCLDNWGLSNITYTQINPSYSSILKASIDNTRFASPLTPKPFLIVTPGDDFDVQGVVRCANNHATQIRIRSGGHDFEGLSYTSRDPFVVVDLFRLNTTTIDVSKKTAWVGAGVTIGQLYYEISKRSNTLAFPAGFCPTVAVGGHFSGGGFGQLFRKYGTAADNVIDARLVDANGQIFDRESMSEDLFWAIRGGGGGSFGVITAWKVNLVDVSEVVTTFSINRTLEQNAAEIIREWQYLAPNFPNEIYFAITMRSVNSGGPRGKTMQATFDLIYHGGVDELLEIFATMFPELGLRRKDCTEGSWIQSLLWFNGYPADESPQVLANRATHFPRFPFKAKSDFVREPITESGLEGLWDFLHEQVETGKVLFIADGGRMSEIPEDALPYPHRKGNFYSVLYWIAWDKAETKIERYIDWSRRIYKYMAPYVSKSPRAAYVNYRDLDLGVNNEYAPKNTPWVYYFKNNFKRLVKVKKMVDPDNIFRHEQSIPLKVPNGEEE